jgi:predicted alpha/beta hydrolase family esterase
MHQWLKKELHKKGFEVIIPEMPNPKRPAIKAWVNKLDRIAKNLVGETYFIGHSIGCQTIMRHLEKQPENVKVRGIVFIAPWFHLEGLEEESKSMAKPWLEAPINLDKVKSHVDKIAAIFSDNDPYVPLSDKKVFKEKLGARIIVEHQKGHFTEDDGVYDNRPALSELLAMRRNTT